MWEKIQKLLDRAESRVALWLWLGGSGMIGLGTGVWSKWSDWVGSFGDFAWIFVGLLAALLSVLIVLSGFEVRFRYIKSKAFRDWSENKTAINPLADEFIRERILISEITDPIENRITGKTFTKCDLLGPSVVIIGGQSVITHSSFLQCDVLEIDDVPRDLFNATFMQDCRITDCRIAKLTILVFPAMAKHFREMGSVLLTDTLEKE